MQVLKCRNNFWDEIVWAFLRLIRSDCNNKRSSLLCTHTQAKRGGSASSIEQGKRVSVVRSSEANLIFIYTQKEDEEKWRSTSSSANWIKSTVRAVTKIYTRLLRVYDIIRRKIYDRLIIRTTNKNCFQERQRQKLLRMMYNKYDYTLKFNRINQCHDGGRKYFCFNLAKGSERR